MVVEDKDIIEMKDVDFSYSGEVPVLRGMSFSLEMGEKIALTGGNGVGKTTMLRLLTGLEHPIRGEIRIFGRLRTIEKDFIEVRRKIGYLFQDSENQLFSPTVFEDVAFGPLNLGLSREEVEQRVSSTLALLGLSGYEGRITYKLSGGEKRLVALATIIAMEPEVYLLDEPTTGLDEKASERVIDIIRNRMRTLILVSQKVEVIHRTTNRVLLIKDGKIADKT